MAAMNADAEVMRYIGDGSAVPFDRDRAAASVGRARREWDDRGFGLLSVIVRETGDYAGWVTLAVPNFLPQVLPAVEIGWRLARNHWGHGYATEAARVALRFGFEECGLDRILSIRHVDNVRSKRVMDKLGLRLEFETTVPARGTPAAVHAITRSEYDTPDLGGARPGPGRDRQGPGQARLSVRNERVFYSGSRPALRRP